MSALGHKRTCAVQKGMSALLPKATLNAFIRMSAMGQKRTLFTLFDHLIGTSMKRSGNIDLLFPGRFKIDYELKGCGLHDWKAGLAPLRIFPA
jgi:hypothetical protein